MDNVLNCDIVVSEFKPQLHFYVHFWTNILGKFYEPSDSPKYIPQLFSQDDFDIK